MTDKNLAELLDRHELEGCAEWAESLRDELKDCIKTLGGDDVYEMMHAYSFITGIKAALRFIRKNQELGATLANNAMLAGMPANEWQEVRFSHSIWDADKVAGVNSSGQPSDDSGISEHNRQVYEKVLRQLQEIGEG